MWTMVSELRCNRTKYHLANDDFISFCGNSRMLVRDYVELHGVNINKVIGNHVVETMKIKEICTHCLRKLYKQPTT